MGDLRTCFKRVDYDLAGLLHYIDIGDIGLPDIQRPFVWRNSKVRDLFDSMYKGFPVGYLLFWENAAVNNGKGIGLETKAHQVPSRLIVDGQQRLTSLYAVFRGKKVLDADYNERTIEIAFRPRDGAFEVADAAIRRDPEFIPSISDIWKSGKSSHKVVKEFLHNLNARTPLTDDDEELISHNLDRLFDLQKYPFTALEIAPSVDEEQVADIFVRINSEGVKLNQADFILTLLSVFWEQGRFDLEDFSRRSRIPPKKGDSASPYNHFIQPSPDQLLRVSVATGFERARLKSVYQILRGKDLYTGLFSVQTREEQFQILKDAQAKVLNLSHWHLFLNALVGAGFRSEQLISSENTLLYNYAFYLIGKHKYQVPEHKLQKVIARWFFASAITGHYTNSPESEMDSDLNRVKGLQDSEAFVETLDRLIADLITHDYWQITLPNDLDSSSPRSPALLSFYAALNKLGAPVLFSDKLVSDLLDPAIRSTKAPLERHHLFPRGWLASQGITDIKVVNQAANYALVEWPDNIHISDRSPSDYVPEIRERFSPSLWERMCYLHALPMGWEHLTYSEFLSQRRQLMSTIIKEGFEKLK